MDFKAMGDSLGLDEDEYRELLNLFMSTGMADFKALDAALAAGDADGVMQKAHTIKGAAGNLGLMDIHETAAFIEEQATDGNLGGVGSMVGTMQGQFDALKTLMDA